MLLFSALVVLWSAVGPHTQQLPGSVTSPSTSKPIRCLGLSGWRSRFWFFWLLDGGRALCWDLQQLGLLSHLSSACLYCSCWLRHSLWKRRCDMPAEGCWFSSGKMHLAIWLLDSLLLPVPLMLPRRKRGRICPRCHPAGHSCKGRNTLYKGKLLHFAKITFKKCQIWHTWTGSAGRKWLMPWFQFFFCSKKPILYLFSLGLGRTLLWVSGGETLLSGSSSLMLST